MTLEMLTKQSGYSGLGFNVGGEPLRFGHNGLNVGFETVTVALADTGQGAVVMMNANADVEAWKDVIVEAIGEQYHWPASSSRKQAPNEANGASPSELGKRN